jgi:hypothetical protein
MTRSEGNGSNEADGHDILRSLDRGMERETVLASSIEGAIRKFLTAANIQGASSSSRDEIETIWRYLDRYPPVVSDFVYHLIETKKSLNLSAYPLALSMEQLMEYCQGSSLRTREGDPIEESEFSLRSTLINHYAFPGLIRIGYSKDVADRMVSGELFGKERLGQAARFLGWLASQEFMSDLPQKIGEYVEEEKIVRADMDHISVVTARLVAATLNDLRKRGSAYTHGTLMEEEASPHYESGVLAMEGLQRLCRGLLPGRPTGE